MSCPHCDDTGWRPVEIDGVRRMERCDCWRESLAGKLLAEAQIPPRYEHCTQRPRLEMVLAYEIVTGTPARELFAGLYDDIEQQIQKRSCQLAQRLKRRPADRATETKLEFLQDGSKPTKPRKKANA